MIVVRHGERMDKADIVYWSQIIMARKILGQEIRNFRRDPPLTENGKAMARRVALTIRKMFLDQSITSVNIYTSRFVRAVQTAREIAIELKINHVHVSGGLASILENVSYRKSSFHFKSLNKLSSICPGVELIDCDDHTSPLYLSTTDWRKAMDTIAQRRGMGVVNIVVAHCETLRALTGENIETPYCCFGVFNQPTALHRESAGIDNPNTHSQSNLTNSISITTTTAAIQTSLSAIGRTPLHTGDIYDMHGRRFQSTDRTQSAPL